ncbi:MAG: hypothetical protein QOJ39_1687 [Candidatus Eremiobacteraeota bacterium]|jgi:hypothetical protein|nr:hypothetical protein [Candidatus Eremiobacteraeota bacterium]
MKMIHLVVALTFASAIGAVPAGATPRIPAFQQEPVQVFDSALLQNPHRRVESQHHVRAGYRAYRFLDPNMVIVGVASSVYVDAAGRLHVVQAHGEPMSGHPNRTGEEYSHILIPPNAVLPKP